MEMRMPANDDMVQVFKTLTIVFSKLTLVEVYVVQQVAVTEVRLRENAVAYQATK